MANSDVPSLGLEHIATGKVREIYELDEQHLVLVTTDRISAFDVVMEESVPNKARVLNGLTAFWFDEVVDLVPSHRADPDVLPEASLHPYYFGRTEVVRRAEMLPLECIVRGYLTGSALAEYQQNGTVHTMPAPKGMVESEAFPEPIFTPSTKAAEGHDMNISFDDAVDLVGRDLASQVRDISLAMFNLQSARAAEQGITMADTKYEFGIIDGKLAICDEVGTPDSSRFWPGDRVVSGQTPPSFDKQYLRDYLKSINFNKQPPAPPLPDEIVANTARKYQQAYELITGLSLRSWPGIHYEV